jgi:hypothetical protein
MASPLENAMKRLAILREEVARVEQFIRDYHAFSLADSLSVTDLMNDHTVDGNVSGEPDALSVDKYWPEGKKMRPDEIARLIERVIREVGQPMTRGQLVEALGRRDVDMAAADKARYIGTIIWRHKAVFKNIEGRGYWLRGEPVPALIPSGFAFSGSPRESDDI